jgi:hypothetical protein
MPQGIITKNLKKHSIRTQEIRERAKYPTLKKKWGKAQTLSRTDIKQNTAAV